MMETNCLSRKARSDGLLVVFAIAALAVGTLVYVLDRPTRPYFLPPALSLANGQDRYFGVLGGSLPDFAHVYAFSLLTAALTPGTGRAPLICGLWFVVDALMKLAQHPTIAPSVAAAVPAFFQRIPIFENTANYFLHGTFDSLDIAAFALGSVAAYATTKLVRNW
jgi:hypothetical protein